jgi:hypothetical protein
MLSKLMVRSLLFLSAAILSFAQPQASPKLEPEASAQLEPQLPSNANQYVREVIQREISVQDDDHTLWRYLKHREDEKGSNDRDVIQTREGQLSRVLLVNGQPLSAEDRRKDEERMLKLVTDPNERAKRQKREQADSDKALQMLKAIPDAFIFKYDGAENGLVRLTFHPNPKYDAPTRELQVFRSLSGKMWVDRKSRRLARIDGALFEDVTFGWGLLGRLNKGGTFAVVQKQVGPNHWEVVSTDVNMSGHAVIFKTINVRQHEILSDFRRIPDDVTMAQAYKMLENGGAVSANSQTGTAKTESVK